MIKWLEKNYRIPGIIAFIIAFAIFYLSSKTFSSSGGVSISFISYIYHFGIFFLFSFFLFVFIVRGKNYGLFGITLLIAILYGALDEFHQAFVVGRHFSLIDIAADSLGVLTSFFVYGWMTVLRKD